MDLPVYALELKATTKHVMAETMVIIQRNHFGQL